MVERFTREDGKVAVLISPEYGAGWSTWVSEEDGEVLLFHTQIVKEVLDGNHRKAASLAARRTYHPRPKQSDISDLESYESSDSEMTMTTIIKNQLDSTSAGADSVDPAIAVDMIDHAKAKSLDTDPAIPADMVDHAKAKSLDTEPIDYSNSVAGSESATNPIVEDDDAGKIAAVSEAQKPLVTKELINMNEEEWLDYCTDYDKIDASWENSYEYHVENSEFASAAAELIVEWLEPGEEFWVSEYNGYETLVRKSDFKPPPCHVA